ncbi:MAG: hypothetical protein GX141_08280 [Armatimonadetes bacterium]|nr:hypothetical protein [Armatimonadota bacterium]
MRNHIATIGGENNPSAAGRNHLFSDFYQIYMIVTTAGDWHIVSILDKSS